MKDTKALSTRSQKSETVAEKYDCRRKRRDNGEIRRLSHFSATVAVFGDKLSHFFATAWTGFNDQSLSPGQPIQVVMKTQPLCSQT